MNKILESLEKNQKISMEKFEKLNSDLRNLEKNVLQKSYEIQERIKEIENHLTKQSQEKAVDNLSNASYDRME